MRANQGFFRRDKDYTVVKPIQLTSTERLNPGTTVKIGQFRLIQLQRWFALRRIGVKGSDWAKQMLKNNDKPFYKPEFDAEPVKQKKPRKLKELQPINFIEDGSEQK